MGMARRFCHLQSVTIDVSCDIVLSKDELEGKTMQLRYNISRRGKMHASCGNILYLKMNSKAKQCSFDIIYREEVKCTRVVEIFFIGLSEDATKGAREPLHRIAYNTLGGIF